MPTSVLNSEFMLNDHSDSQAPEKNQTSERMPITDSPWFWLYLFSTFGLIVAIAFAPKINARQRELDLEAAAKRQVINRASNPQTNEEDTETAILNAPNARHNSRFLAILIVLGTLTLGGWIGLWWGRMRSRQTTVKAPKA